MSPGEAERRRRPFVAQRRTLGSRCALAALLLAFASTAHAQLFVGAGQRADRGSAQPPHPSVARIIVPEADGISYGSGTLIDVRDNVGLVISNWHVVAEATGQVTVVFPDGFQTPARVLRTDKDWDLAALAIWKPNVQPVAISASAPRPGDPLAIAGYGPGPYRMAVGRCTQYLAPSDRLPYEMVEVSAEARQGDSGGPILNQRGELAGVLFGAARGTTSGSFCGRVRQFLAPILSGSEQLANIEPPPEQSPTPNAASNQLANASPPQPEPPPMPLSQSQPTEHHSPLLKPPAAETSLDAGPANDIGPIGGRPATITQPNVPPSFPAAEAPNRTDLAAVVPLERRIEDNGYTPLPPRGAVPNAAPNATSTFGNGFGESADPYQKLWRQIAGPTAFDQGKTIFAALGALTILYRFLGRDSSRESDDGE